MPADQSPIVSSFSIFAYSRENEPQIASRPSHLTAGPRPGPPGISPPAASFRNRVTAPRAPRRPGERGSLTCLR